ncbi:MAG: hypothetical protein AAB074_21760 [Planctomycetota bacterium]
MKPLLKFRHFESTTESWQTLFGQAMLFANRLDPRQLVSISHSCDKSTGVVAVWFWDRLGTEPEQEGTESGR